MSMVRASVAAAPIEPALRSAAAGPRVAEAPAESDTVVAPRKLEAAAPQPRSLLASRLVIELDAAAARFVQMRIGDDDLVVRRYPDERQLAFSRGVNAYLAAVTRR